MDDEEIVRGLTVQVLERAGYDVLAVESAHHAIELVLEDGEPQTIRSVRRIR